MLMAYSDSGDERYLECAKRRVGYMKAQRRDGGLFRGTYIDFTTDFRQPPAHRLCGCSLLELYQITGEGMCSRPTGPL